MDAPNALPLDQLSHRCAECLHRARPTACDACRTLLYRALCTGNDAAWDLMVGHLWSAVFQWIYRDLPEITPADAEAVASLALHRFRQQYHHPADLATFPTFSTLMADLQRYTVQILKQQLTDSTRTHGDNFDAC
jgi:hypothetical protein